MQFRQIWPFSLIVMGTILAVGGLLDPACNCAQGFACTCSTSPNYALSIGGLIVAIIFTYVFVFLTTGFQRTEPFVSTSA